MMKALRTVIASPAPRKAREGIYFSFRGKRRICFRASELGLLMLFAFLFAVVFYLNREDLHKLLEIFLRSRP